MKILVCGDVNGNIQALMTRVGNLVNKTPGFDMLLCAGSFFSDTPTCDKEWEAVKQGKLTVPLPVYILGPSSQSVVRFYKGVDPNGEDLAPDITYLGQNGLYRTAEGLQVAYLSGCYDPAHYTRPSSSKDGMVPYFNQENVRDLAKSCEYDEFKGVDIFISSEWPQRVNSDTTDVPEGITSKTGSTSVSRLAFMLKPRYHFTSQMDTFYERTPYRNHEVLREEQRHVTRFISLANVGNPDKKNRYLYAFSIEPLRSIDRRELVQQPQLVTANPYRDIARQKDLHSEPSSGHSSSYQGDTASGGFFFDAKAIAAGRKRQQREQDRLMQQMQDPTGSTKRHKPPQPKGPCWFCLGSAEVEKHLIVSIGNFSYTAIPKGQLVQDHILVIPIGHYPSLLEAPKDVYDEIMSFKEALRAYFVSKGKSCVVFERNYRSQHLQLQVVPVPECESGALRQAFREHGRPKKIDFMETPRDAEISEVLSSGVAYFSAEFDDGPNLLARITGFFSLQFGREVLASPLILNVPKRVDWKSCAVSKEQESSSAEEFREKFKSFDFTLENDD